MIEAIRNAQQGVMALMFTPGQSPLLTEILARAAEQDLCQERCFECGSAG
ncbi:MAG: hypothetical protein IPF97_08175 [Sphingomonadales bacterium]|nr:hypothetical protein [Sphingomonadales bacterium]